MSCAKQPDTPLKIDHAKAHRVWLETDLFRDRPRMLQGDIIGREGENLLQKYAPLAAFTREEEKEILRRHHERSARGDRSRILSGNLGASEEIVAAMDEELRLAKRDRAFIDFTEEDLEEARMLAHCQGAEIRRHCILHPVSAAERELAVGRFREHLEALGFGPEVFGLTDKLEVTPHLEDRLQAEYYRDVVAGNLSDKENVRGHVPQMLEKLTVIDQTPEHLGLGTRMRSRMNLP